MSAESENPNHARGDLGYHITLMGALTDLFHEAASEGILREAEDLIEVMWASIPSDDKMRMKIQNAARTSKITANAAWQEACEIKAPAEVGEYWIKNGQRVPMSEADFSRHRSNKERVTRKLQVWTDVIFELGFLYRRELSSIADPDPEDTDWVEMDNDPQA